MANTTQDFVSIKEIRDDVVVLKDGGIRGVIVVSSVNFALKSADEKQAIILQYQNFLNSLDFHIQFYIQSRRLDIKPYVQVLEDIQKDQTNELLKVQTGEYIEFVKDLTSRVDIMSKSFFIVIPYSPPVLATKGGILSNILPSKKTASEQESDDFEENKTQLEQRISIVQQGLASVGLRSTLLGTEELIELYFKIFNPDEGAIPSVSKQENETTI